MDCAWQLIHDRLIELGKEGAGGRPKPPKDWRTSFGGGPRRIVREELKMI